MRRLFAIALALGLLLTVLGASQVEAKAWTVRCGTGADLQKAIDRAEPEDKLIIWGTCRGNFVVDKALTLEGEGRRASLKGSDGGAVLDIVDPRPHATGPHYIVRVRQLTIAGGEVGVRVNDELSAELRRLTVRHNKDGIRLSTFSRVRAWDLVVSNNSGDGVVNEHGRFTMRDSIVRDNAGNGLSNHMQGSTRLYNSVVAGNEGRGIVNRNAASHLVGSTVRDNSNGGIANSDLSYLSVRGSRIVDNASAGRGGGVYIGDPWSVASGGVTIEDSVIRGNRAETFGGGIYREAPSDRGEAARTDFLTRVKIDGNDAGSSGGGIYSDGALLKLADATPRDNTPNDCVGC